MLSTITSTLSAIVYPLTLLGLRIIQISFTCMTMGEGESVVGIPTTGSHTLIRQENRTSSVYHFGTSSTPTSSHLQKPEAVPIIVTKTTIVLESQHQKPVMALFMLLVFALVSLVIELGVSRLLSLFPRFSSSA